MILELQMNLVMNIIDKLISKNDKLFFRGSNTTYKYKRIRTLVLSFIFLN